MPTVDRESLAYAIRARKHNWRVDVDFEEKAKGLEMPPDRTAEIPARVEQATKGPWKARHSNLHGAPYVGAPGTIGEDAVFVATCSSTKMGMADAEFIAHAREDIPYLLAENRRLREELACQVAPEELRQWKAEVQRLQEENEEWQRQAELATKVITSWTTLARSQLVRAEAAEAKLAEKE